jgi:hypothetical protein
MQMRSYGISLPALFPILSSLIQLSGSNLSNAPDQDSPVPDFDHPILCPQLPGENSKEIDEVRKVYMNRFTISELRVDFHVTTITDLIYLIKQQRNLQMGS